VAYKEVGPEGLFVKDNKEV